MQCGLRPADMAGNGPDDWVEQCEKQTAIEGGGCPKRRGRSQPESARKQRPVRHAGIAEEVVNRVEEVGQQPGVEARRRAALGEALS